MVYIYFVCVIILVLIYSYLYTKHSEGFMADLLNGKKSDNSEVHQIYTIPDDFLGSLCMFKERNEHIYAYNKRDETIYKTKKATSVTFRKNINGWEKVIEISSLNDYDVLGKIMILLTNEGVRVYDVLIKSGEFMDIFTDIIDTTFIENTSVTYTRTDGISGINGLSCTNLSEKVNTRNQEQGTNDENNPVEYLDLNAEECEKYASERANLPYKYEPNVGRLKGCIIKDKKEVHYNPTGKPTNPEPNKDWYIGVCKQVNVTDKLSENPQATKNPKVFKLMNFSPTMCALKGSTDNMTNILLCDRNRRTIVPLDISIGGMGVNIKYNGDKITTDENVFVFTKVFSSSEYIACVLENKINHLYEFDFNQAKQHTKILDYAYWDKASLPDTYGMTRQVIDDAIIYGVWMNGDILIIYGLFGGLFQSENERICMLKLRLGTDSGKKVQLEDLIRLPANVQGSSLRSIYERLGSSNLYYKQPSVDTNKSSADFVLATNKTKTELSFYGKTGSSIGDINTTPENPPKQPDKSNAINEMTDYNLSSPASQGINDYLMYPENTTGSKEIKEGDYIYFVLRSPVLLKGFALKTLNNVYVKAFKIEMPEGELNISGIGGAISDKTKYIVLGNNNYGIQGDRKNKITDVDMYHIKNDPHYVSMIRITILKLIDVNNPLAMGNLVSNFQGVLYGLRTETDEAMQRQYDAQNASCEADYEKALEINASKKEKDDGMKSKMDEIKNLLQESGDGKALETKCKEYFEKALSYFNDPNSTREEKLEGLKYYRKSISACSAVIKNKYLTAEKTFREDAEELNNKEIEILRNLRKLENTLEKIKSYDGENVYLDGYNQGYALFDKYILKRSDNFKKRHIGHDGDGGRNKVLKDGISDLENRISTLKIILTENEICPKKQGTINKINKYLKYTYMYTILNRFLGNTIKTNN